MSKDDQISRLAIFASGLMMTSQGFIQDFRQEGTNVAIVKLRGGGEDLIVFLGFVGEEILWYNSNYSNKGGLGALS